ncbi:MAG: alkaline phosphatase [Dehalococcoidia bacterium]
MSPAQALERPPALRCLLSPLRRPPGMSRVLSRRFLLRSAISAAAGALLWAPSPTARAQVRWSGDPFQLGVACGDLSNDGFVIWTRLAPEPMDASALGAMPYDVAFEVAEDREFRNVRKRGWATAWPHLAHTVRVEIDGLESGREYFYRFFAGREESPTGRALTAPREGHGALRFAITSCAHYEQGYFSAYRHLAADRPDIVFALGDYIYESSWGWRQVRAFDVKEARTLDDFRRRYALYRMDSDLQAAHRACPWLFTWDDHEVENDYSGEHSEHEDCGGSEEAAAFLARKKAAYQAYFENMPIRASRLRGAGSIKIHDSVAWGDLARLILLDNRQYRSRQACSSPATAQSCDPSRRVGIFTGGGEAIDPAEPRCKADLEDPRRTMLGFEQEDWLDGELSRSSQRWTLLAQSLFFSPLREGSAERQTVFTDSWGGYPLARRRLLASAKKHRVRNLVVASGDVHCFWANEIPGSGDENVGTEFVTSSIATQVSSRQRLMGAANPHLRFHDGAHSGYVRFDVSADRMRAAFIGVDDIRDPASGAKTLATFEVSDGAPRLARTDATPDAG